MIYRATGEEFVTITCFINVPNLGKQFTRAVISEFAAITFFFFLNLPEK